MYCSACPFNDLITSTHLSVCVYIPVVIPYSYLSMVIYTQKQPPNYFAVCRVPHRCQGNRRVSFTRTQISDSFYSFRIVLKVGFRRKGTNGEGYDHE
jgi:hypothetical protein